MPRCITPKVKAALGDQCGFLTDRVNSRRGFSLEPSSPSNREKSVESSDGTPTLLGRSRSGDSRSKSPDKHDSPSTLRQRSGGESLTLTRLETDLARTMSEHLCPFAELYTLDEQLGEGGYSVVWKATCKKTQQKVAVKTFGEKKALNEERVMSELRIQRYLNHPNIMQVYELIRDSGSAKLYLTLELCEGQDLGRKMKELGRMPRLVRSGNDCSWPVESLGKLFYQLAESIRYLAQTKIAHRDVKPNNFMVNCHGYQQIHAGAVKLIDFGFARTFRDDVRMFSKVGTPDFVAPEVIFDQGGYTAKCDVYSLGATLYYLCVNQAPFQRFRRHETEQACMKNAGAVMYDQPPWRKLSRPGASFRHLAEMMLTRSPDNRPSMEQVMQENGHWLQGTDPACCTVS